MGKSLRSSTNLLELARILSSRKPRHRRPPPSIVSLRQSEVRVDSERARVKRMAAQTSISIDGQTRMPLAAVVSECVTRWFHDTLKEAKAGDVSMQILVGQMYYCGYGVPQDVPRARAWIHKASKARPSAWRVIQKRPGCNVSDSDSDEVKCDKLT